MRAKYTGPEIAVEVFGLIFARGSWVDVPSSSTHARAKLPSHPEFEVDGKAPAPVPPAAPVRVQRAG